MQKPVDPKDILVAARLNGKDIIRPFSEMWRLFWKCHYGWLLPLDWYRWSVEGRSDGKYIFDLMTTKPRAFGLLMHMRGNRSLTRSDYELLIKDSITDDVFQKLASRFNVLYLALPPALWPFFYYRQEIVGFMTEPAYRMEPCRQRIVIEGVAEGQNISDDDVDWSMLLQPPLALPESQRKRPRR